jgi:hypothetical protein
MVQPAFSLVLSVNLTDRQGPLAYQHQARKGSQFGSISRAGYMSRSSTEDATGGRHGGYVIFKLLNAASGSSSSACGLLSGTVVGLSSAGDTGEACRCCGVKKEAGFHPGAIRFISSTLRGRSAFSPFDHTSATCRTYFSLLARSMRSSRTFSFSIRCVLIRSWIGGA